MRPLLAAFVVTMASVGGWSEEFEGFSAARPPRQPVPDIGSGRVIPTPEPGPPPAGPISLSEGVVHDDSSASGARKEFEAKVHADALKILESSEAGKLALLRFDMMRDRWSAARKAYAPKIKAEIAEDKEALSVLEKKPGVDPEAVARLRKDCESKEKHLLPVHESDIPAKVKVQFKAMEGDGMANMFMAVIWGNPDGTGLHYMFNIALNENLLLSDNPAGETARVLGRELNRLSEFDKQNRGPDFPDHIDEKQKRRRAALLGGQPVDEP